MNEMVLEGFEEYERRGWDVNYTRFDNTDPDKTVVRPYFPAEAFDEQFPIKGEKVVYLDENGYDLERSLITNRYGVDKGDVLTIKRVSIGSTSTDYTFEEIAGEHNSVMFEKYVG